MGDSRSLSPSPPLSSSEGEISSGDEGAKRAPRSTNTNKAEAPVINMSARNAPKNKIEKAELSMHMLSTDKYYHFRDDDGVVRHFPGERSRSRSPWRQGKPTRHDLKNRSRSPWRVNKASGGKERSRSRSPWRANKPSGGEKRRREDDHYNRKDGSDPRRFKVHYEDSGRPGSRQKYSDSDRPQSARSTPSYEDRRGRRPSRSYNPRQERGRPRERSRSPFRHNKNSAYGQKGNRQQGAARWDSHSYGFAGQQKTWGQRPKGDVPSVHQSEYIPDSSHEQKHAKIKMSLSQHSSSKAEEPVKHESVKSYYPPGARTDGVRSNVEHKEQSNEQVEDTSEPQRQLSDAEIIEERRKRREAIKAKHKTNPPLLVQALEQNSTSAPPTPLRDSSGVPSEQQSPPSSMDSPQTPQAYSPPDSPAAFTVNNDEDLVDRRAADEEAHEDEGPSAADYDPNLDMEEDRPDHKRQELQAPATQNGAINEPEKEQKSASKQPKEYDMFAEDDDYDMFAPEDATTQAGAGGIKQARALDASMLDNWDYPDGHYRIIIGELLNDRYAVVQQIGKGTFATVVRAQDTRTGNFVAVKIACNNETMYKAGEKEMDMLSLLNKNDPEDKKHIIQLLGHFNHKGHLCLVFENLSDDLREILKKFGRNVGINLKAIRAYAQQLFLSLSHLKKCQILHADLKPDNILVSEKRSLLKICDLGTASFAEDAEVTPYLVSRFYRAPEVILGMPFDYAIDMWSIGCTLFELYTGRICFAGADNNQMLRAIQECRGKLPIRMLKRSTLADKHFDIDGNFYSQERDKNTGKATIRQILLHKTAPGKDLRARLGFNTKGMQPEEAREHATFVDLMEKCLQLDPARRITPSDALRHNFIVHAATVPQVQKVKPALKVPMKVPSKKAYGLFQGEC